MLERYDISETVPFLINSVDKNGVPVSSQIIKVDILDLDNIPGGLLVSGQALAELTIAGYYLYDWQHGFTTNKRLIAKVYQDDGGKILIINVFKLFIENLKQLLTDKIDENDGQAV